MFVPEGQACRVGAMVCFHMGDLSLVLLIEIVPWKQNIVRDLYLVLLIEIIPWE